MSASSAELLSRINELPESLSLSGEVLMSGIDTLDRSTKLTIMGFNPGGEDLPSVASQCEAYLSHPERQRDFSAYLHQCWHKGYWPDRHCPRCADRITVADNHQRRVRAYCDRLGVSPEQALSLNAIFFQTKDTDDYLLLAKARGLSGQALFEQRFWPIQHWLLSTVTSTRVLLCLGNAADNSAFTYVRKAFRASDRESTLRKYPDGKYFWQDDLLVVGVGHPSQIEVTQACLELLDAAGEYLAGRTSHLVR